MGITFLKGDKDMKVKDFINLLQTMPQDIEIVDWSGEKVEGCRVLNDWPDRDPADPKCQEISVVIID